MGNGAIAQPNGDVAIGPLNTKADPFYVRVPAGSIQSLALTAVQTSDTNASLGQLIRTNPSLGSFHVFLPPAINGSGEIVVKVQYSGPNFVTVVPNGTDTIDGQGNQILLGRASITLYSDGISDWMVT